MAEAASMRDLISCRGHRSDAPSSLRRRRGISCVGFSRSSYPPIKSMSASHRCVDLYERKAVVEWRRSKPMKAKIHFSPVQMNLCVGKALRWWEKGLQPNMQEIKSAQDLADSLLGAGNKLAILDFYSPGCGGCKALHPKVCQFAEMNPDFLFLQINYEEHKSMCYSLNVHVLPFFRFYRGAEGRLCSFSCTNATIKKFKDAMAKHATDRCSLGPAKGLEESELVALDTNRELSFNYMRSPFPEPISAARSNIDSQDKFLIAARR